MTPSDDLVRRLRDEILAAYKEHYDFPSQGESHMRDCLDDILEAQFAARAEPLLPHIGTGDTPKPWTDEDKARLLAALEPYARPTKPDAMTYAADVMEKHGWHQLAHDSAERLAYAALRMEVADAPPDRAEPQPVAWRIRIGDSDRWGYCDTEEDADFLGKQSGLRYVKEPLCHPPACALGGEPETVSAVIAAGLKPQIDLALHEHAKGYALGFQEAREAAKAACRKVAEKANADYEHTLQGYYEGMSDGADACETAIAVLDKP